MKLNFRVPIVGAIVSLSIASIAGHAAAAGDYSRVVLVSWDGVRRDVLNELLAVSNANSPCWQGGTVYPVSTGRTTATGDPIFTCLPALAGIKPGDAAADAPAYGAFQVLASHTTNDGETMTQPQHAAMLSGFPPAINGISSNVSVTRLAEGTTIYERLMDSFDPRSPAGIRNGHVFHTHHSADKKFVGTNITYWAKRDKALQTVTGHGNDEDTRPGALTFATTSFAAWKTDAASHGLAAPSFFMFLHFKSTDWTGHLSGDGSPAYRKQIVATDRKLYTLLEMLRSYGWDDAAVIVATDHGFHGNTHSRNSGRTVFDTWIAAHNVVLSSAGIPLRTEQDYCASRADTDKCLATGPDEPMPAEDIVPNVYVTSIVPTILDMFGVDWHATTLAGPSLYHP